MSEETWEEVVTIINYEFIRTRTPLNVKMLRQIIIDAKENFEEAC